MILCHDDQGRVYLTYNDPIPDGLEQMLTDNGTSFVRYKPLNAAYGAALINAVFVANGEVVQRPECAATITQTGRTLRLDNVPEGSTVTAIIDAGTPFEHREVITDYHIEFDEPCAVDFVINPPFPMKDGSHNVEIQ